MTTECGFCKGTGIEPGFTECVWCDNTGRDSGIQLDNIKRACAEIRAVAEGKEERRAADEAESFYGELRQGGTLCQRALTHINALRAELATSRAAFKEELDGVKFTRRRFRQERDALQQRLTAMDERADGFEQRIARLRHVGMELTGVIDEYRALPCDSLQVRMFQTADRYRRRLTAKCGNCEDYGVIGYTTGQTPETFEQGEYPCPECHPTEYAAWSKP